MKKKPEKGQTIVYKVDHVWRGIWRVKWTDDLNYPRFIETLFRKVDGQWTTGEANPVGAHNSGLLRVAVPAIEKALEAKLPTKQEWEEMGFKVPSELCSEQKGQVAR